MDGKTLSFTLGEYMTQANDCASTLMARDYKQAQSIVNRGGVMA